MIKRTITLGACILFLSTIFFVACQDSPEANSGTISTDMTTAEPAEKPKPKVPLPATPVDENDIAGRLLFGIRTLEQEFDRSSADMADIGKVRLKIEQNGMSNMINTLSDGTVYETKFDIKSLNIGNDGMRLVAESSDQPYPGVQIYTERRVQSVEYYKDGKLLKKSPSLDIFMVDREAIQKIVPAMVQTIRIAKDNL